MDILIWGIVGLVAGVGVSLIFRSAGSIVLDIVVGIAGAFVGGFIFRVTDLHILFGGFAGMIVVVFGGAVVVLGALRLFRRARPEV